MSWVDPADAAEWATQSLALARRAGQPTAINLSLLALARTLADKEPDGEAALLRDASSAGYKSASELSITTNVAAYLGDWPATLCAASRLLRLDCRSGAIALFHLTGPSPKSPAASRR
jgi:hypothetical protein